ncbi:MAG TPA: DUF3568 family protein [Longimicrobiales bacterium]|nr:DUF3568 family protein [Longimicrobiales bacterium]
MSRKIMSLRLLAVLALVSTATGCIAAAAAAGAAGAIAYTERGANSEVNASVNTLLQATEATFSEMNIVIIERKTAENGTEVELKGNRGDLDVTVNIHQDNPPTTKIDVTAKRNVVDYDRDYARDILQRVLKRLS